METTLNQDTFTILVPKIDTKRFKGIVKAMGWTITSISQSTEKTRLYDPESGDYLNDETMRAIEDSRKGIDVNSYASFDDFAKAMRAL